MQEITEQNNSEYGGFSCNVNLKYLSQFEIISPPSNNILPGLEITKFLSQFEKKSKKVVKIQIAVKIEMIYGMFL